MYIGPVTSGQGTTPPRKSGQFEAASSGAGVFGADHVMNSAPGQATSPFAGVLQEMVSQTQELDSKAAKAVSGLMNGTGGEIHDAMIATQKADMAFELALQVRNKAVAAYQQMMGMQF